MKRIISILLILSASQLLWATKPTTKVFKTLPFEKVAITGGFEINISQCKNSALQIIGMPAVVNRIKVAVREGLLTIEMAKDRDRRLHLRNDEIPTINLYVTNLNNLQIDGYANLKSQNVLKAKALSVRLSGSSKIDLALICQTFDITSGGASYIRLKGESEKVKLTMNGAGMYDGFGLNTNNTTVVINGTGKAQISAKKQLIGSINGFGAVYYKGKPTVEIKKEFGVVKRIP